MIIIVEEKFVGLRLGSVAAGGAGPMTRLAEGKQLWFPPLKPSGLNILDKTLICRL